MHTLALAEALHALGAPVTVVGLGDRFFRDVDAPCVLFPAPDGTRSLDEKVFRSVDVLAAGLSEIAGDYDVLHAQDCIAARAAARVRDAGGGQVVARTVHHVDDFTTPALIDCQRQAIVEPDHVLVVSRHWQRLLRDEYGVASEVVYNGVDAERFAAVDARRRAEFRDKIGASDARFVFLAVGGIEPRKATADLFAALADVRRTVTPAPMLAIVGGHSFQDYAAYREAALARLPDLGMELGRDVVLLGTVPDDDLAGWYGAADALAFPSVKEGWGLVVLEAQAAGLPVIATDIPVLREYLTDGVDALLVPPHDPTRLAEAMRRIIADPDLRGRLADGGRAVAARYTWAATARRHMEIYAFLSRKSTAEVIFRDKNGGG